MAPTNPSASLDTISLLYRNLFASDSRGIVVCKAIDSQGSDFVILDINEAALRIDSISIGDALGKQLYAIMPYLAVTDLPHAVELVRQSGVPEFCPVSWQPVSGAKIWREYYLYRLPDNVIVVEYEDVSPRKQAEALLLANEDRYKHMVETLTDYIYSVRIVDDSPIATVHGPGCLTVTGYSIDDFAADPYLWINMVPDQDRAHVMDFSRKVVNNEEVAPLEHRIIHRSGFVRWVSNSPVRYYDVSGRLLSYDGVVQDITERKLAEESLAQSEERYRSLVDNITIGVALVSSSNTIITANNRMRALFPDLSRYDTLHCLAAILDPGSFMPCAECPIKQTFANGTSHSVVHELTSGNNAIVYRIIATPVFEHGQRVESVIVMVEDITEYRRLETELQKQQQIESLSVLAGGIAHDFNNLLGGIFGYIDMARDLADEPVRVRDFMNKAMKSLARAKDLSARLLTFTKSGTPVKKTSVIGEVVMDALALSLAGTNVKADVQISNDTWCCDIDQAQIGRVINNLAINAVQAMPTGGTLTVKTGNVTVEADSNALKKAGDYVVLSFCDTGNGIAPEHINKIFDPFFTTKSKGSGLGLAICYSIVKKHDGYIQVEPSVYAGSPGTTFTLYLPAQRSAVYCVNSGQNPGQSLQGSGKILIMDDEEFILDLSTTMLTELGYAPTTVQHGEQAIEEYNKALEHNNPFKAVVLDLTVPGGMGGVQTLQELKKKVPSIVAIASSGFSNAPVLVDPAAYGFAGILKKPYVKEDLGAVLKKVLSE